MRCAPRNCPVESSQTPLSRCRVGASCKLALFFVRLRTEPLRVRPYFFAAPLGLRLLGFRFPKFVCSVGCPFQDFPQWSEGPYCLDGGPRHQCAWPVFNEQISELSCEQYVEVDVLPRASSNRIRAPSCPAKNPPASASFR